MELNFANINSEEIRRQVLSGRKKVFVSKWLKDVFEAEEGTIVYCRDLYVLFLSSNPAFVDQVPVSTVLFNKIVKSLTGDKDLFPSARVKRMARGLVVENVRINTASRAVQRSEHGEPLAQDDQFFQNPEG